MIEGQFLLGRELLTLSKGLVITDGERHRRVSNKMMCEKMNMSHHTLQHIFSGDPVLSDPYFRVLMCIVYLLPEEERLAVVWHYFVLKASLYS
jgi:hypothetical protein